MDVTARKTTSLKPRRKPTTIQARDVASIGWHFDRRIPIANLIALLLQTGAVVWWASNINSRVEVLEGNMRGTMAVIPRIYTTENLSTGNLAALQKVTGALENMSTRISNVEVKAANVEGKVDQINTGVNDLKHTMDQLTTIQVKRPDE